jgi:hypothetical protein
MKNCTVKLHFGTTFTNHKLHSTYGRYDEIKDPTFVIEISSLLNYKLISYVNIIASMLIFHITQW